MSVVPKFPEGQIESLARALGEFGAGAADYFTLISLLHRKLDRCFKVNHSKL